MTLTGNPDSTVLECLNTILALVPTLDNYFKILEPNDKGNIHSNMKLYGFTHHIQNNQKQIKQRKFTQIFFFTFLKPIVNISIAFVIKIQS